MPNPEHGTWEITVAATVAPDGRDMVLLQLPDSYILISAPDAYRIAGLLTDAADVIEVES